MNSLLDILVLHKTVIKVFGVKWSEKSECLQERRRQPDRKREKIQAVFSAAAWTFPKHGLRGQPYSLSGLNPSQTVLLGSHPGRWMARCCVNGCVDPKYEQTVSSLFDRQVVKNIRGSRNISYRKLHRESAFLDLFGGYWALKEEEENRLLQLTQMSLGQLTHEQWGMAKKVRRPWKEKCGHTFAPLYITLHVTLCLACAPQHGGVPLLQLHGPTWMSSHAHVIPSSWERSCLHPCNTSGFLGLQVFILWKAKYCILRWLSGNEWTYVDKKRKKTDPRNL